MKITRRTFLRTTGALALSAAAADALSVEPDFVEFSEHMLGAAADSGSRTIRFAQLTDLHLQGIGALHFEIANRLRESALDFILLTGDMVDTRGRLAVLDAFLSLLDAHVPCFATLGNWEHWGNVDLNKLAAVYRRHNGRLLVNETAEFRTGDARVLLTGMDDSTGGEPSLELALEGVEPSPHHIILAHSPIYRDYLADYRTMIADDPGRITAPVDLDRYSITCVLSGHTHGGQVVIAGWAPYLPVGSGPYLRGWYRDRTPHLFVSRGIGTTMLPVRFGARPEVPIFSLAV